MKIFTLCCRAESTYLMARIKDRLNIAFGEPSVFRDRAVIPAGVDFKIVLENETIGRNVIKGLCRFQ